MEQQIERKRYHQLHNKQQTKKMQRPDRLHKRKDRFMQCIENGIGHEWIGFGLLAEQRIPFQPANFGKGRNNARVIIYRSLVSVAAASLDRRVLDGKRADM